jgi:hypothetical protein
MWGATWGPENLVQFLERILKEQFEIPIKIRLDVNKPWIDSNGIIMLWFTLGIELPLFQGTEEELMAFREDRIRRIAEQMEANDG